MPLLEVDNLTKYYGDTPALRGVSLSIAAGKLVCLLGPSGCGKTTLLRVIAGLERADGGVVRFEGRPIDDVPTHRRGFGLMFQEYALFPHRNVADNVAFGLRMRNMPRYQIEKRVAEMLALVGLQGYEQRRVYELSGGERQRVALARSLAPSPRLLMLDEPLGALDRTLRERLTDELRAIIKRVGVTSIYVTHDQAEAFALSDWLVLMNAGQIEQQGPPEEIYRNPATLFAARFLGMHNLLQGTVQEVQPSTIIVQTALGCLLATDTRHAVRPGDPVTLVVRPEAATLIASEQHGSTNAINVHVLEHSFRGSRTYVKVHHNSIPPLVFELDGSITATIGADITLVLRQEAISVIRSGEVVSS